MIDKQIVRDFINDINEKIEKNYKEFDVALVISKIIDRDEKEISDELINKVHKEINFKDSLWDKEFEEDILDLDNAIEEKQKEDFSKDDFDK